MRRCDTQQLTEESIMELIRQRGNLRFSTLMVFFHISSVEALAIVEEYQKKGILDAKGRIKTAQQKENRKLHDDVVTGQQGKKEVPEKAGKIPIKKEKETLPKARNKSAEIQPSKRKEQPKKKSKSKKLIQRNFMKPAASDVEGQISLFDYMQFGG